LNNTYASHLDKKKTYIELLKCLRQDSINLVARVASETTAVVLLLVYQLNRWIDLRLSQNNFEFFSSCWLSLIWLRFRLIFKVQMKKNLSIFCLHLDFCNLFLQFLYYIISWLRLFKGIVSREGYYFLRPLFDGWMDIIRRQGITLTVKYNNKKSTTL